MFNIEVLVEKELNSPLGRQCTFRTVLLTSDTEVPGVKQLSTSSIVKTIGKALTSIKK